MIFRLIVRTTAGDEEFPIHVSGGTSITAIELHADAGPLLVFPFQLTDGPPFYVKWEPHNDN